ncbi:hypothetical protein [Pseudoalteromonas piscicida]|uniref:hypothetical protein n=1 Tax=Pseudoalteromonas piscicida TaxID=43662 RepID=UPI0030B25C62
MLINIFDERLYLFLALSLNTGKYYSNMMKLNCSFNGGCPFNFSLKDVINIFDERLYLSLALSLNTGKYYSNMMKLNCSFNGGCPFNFLIF